LVRSQCSFPGVERVIHSQRRWHLKSPRPSLSVSRALPTVVVQEQSCVLRKGSRSPLRARCHRDAPRFGNTWRECISSRDVSVTCASCTALVVDVRGNSPSRSPGLVPSSPTFVRLFATPPRRFLAFMDPRKARAVASPSNRLLAAAVQTVLLEVRALRADVDELRAAGHASRPP
jgi:hypothetical protein